MSDQTFKVDPGDEIVISVPKNNPSGHEILMRRPTAPKGMIRARRADEHLPRRIRQNGYINFYDLGQVLSGGEYVDADFSYLPETLLEFNIALSEDSVLDNLKNKLNAPLAFDRHLWKSKYRRIDFADAEKYRFAVKLESDDAPRVINQENDDWQIGGLTSSPSDSLLLENALPPDGKRVYYDFGGAFAGFDTSSPFVKITANQNYESAEVPFSLSQAQADVFLNPAIFSFVAGYVVTNTNVVTITEWVHSDFGVFIGTSSSCTDVGGGTILEYEAQQRTTTQDSDVVLQLLNYFVTHWQRRLILDDSLRTEYSFPENKIAVDAMKLHTQTRAIESSSSFDAFSYDIRVRPGQTELGVKFCGAVPPPVSGSNNSEGPIGGFIGDATSSSSVQLVRTVPEKSLLAAINQGGRWFYVWQRVSDEGGAGDEGGT